MISGLNCAFAQLFSTPNKSATHVGAAQRPH
jgi:hypothetical protein